MKAEAVKNLLNMEPTNILLLQETKIEEVPLLSISRSKWKKNAGVAISAKGTSGGLSTLWSDDKFILKSSYVTQHWIYTKLQLISSKTFISLFNLYVPVYFLEKSFCWNTLSEYMEIHSPINITVAGDINIILDPKEKRGGARGKDPF